MVFGAHVFAHATFPFYFDLLDGQERGCAGLGSMYFWNKGGKKSE